MIFPKFSSAGKPTGFFSTERIGGVCVCVCEKTLWLKQTNNEHIVAPTCGCPFVMYCIVEVVKSGLTCLSALSVAGSPCLKKGGTDTQRAKWNPSVHSSMGVLMPCLQESIVFSGRDESQRSFSICNASLLLLFESRIPIKWYLTHTLLYILYYKPQKLHVSYCD